MQARKIADKLIYNYGRDEALKRVELAISEMRKSDGLKRLYKQVKECIINQHKI